MNTKRNVYIVSSAVSLGIYLAGSALGTIASIFLYVASGYADPAAVKGGESPVGTALIVLFTLVDHVFFSWLAVKLIGRYAQKHDFLKMRVFVVSAAAVCACFAAEILLGLTPGVLTVLSHAAGILLFGLLAVRRRTKGRTE